MYITPNGRIVTPQALPWSAVEMIRRSHDGNIIDKDTITAEPTPRAPAAKRVQSRDSRGQQYPLRLIPRMASPDRTIITKDGRELNSGFANMLERRTFGPPQHQLRQLQMLKGVYKTETCRYDAIKARDVARATCVVSGTASTRAYNLAGWYIPFVKRYSTNCIIRILPCR